MDDIAHALAVHDAALAVLGGRGTPEDKRFLAEAARPPAAKPASRKTIYGTRDIRVGDQFKLRGHRSHLDGRRALVVTVTGLMPAPDSRLDRFIASDGRREFYGVFRSQLVGISGISGKEARGL